MTAVRGEVDEGVAAVAVPSLGQRMLFISLSGPEAHALKQLVFRIRDTLKDIPGTWNKKDVLSHNSKAMKGVICIFMAFELSYSHSCRI